MKIAITKKIKIEINRNTMVLAFVLIVIALFSFLAYMGFYEYNKDGKAQQIKTTSDKDITIDKKEVEKTNDYRDLGTPIDLNNGYGKTEPFR